MTRATSSSLFLLFVIFSAPSLQAAGYKATVEGIRVSYTNPEAEAYISDLGFLVVEIQSSGGSLKVSADKTAPTLWGSFCPLVILATDQSLRSVTVTGLKTGFFFSVIGECYVASKFVGFNADIGGITEAGGEAFDPETGLYFAAGAPLPIVLQLKSGRAWGTFGGADLSAEVVAAPLKVQVAGELKTLKVAHPRLRALLGATAGRGQVKGARGLSSSRKL